MLKNKSVWLLLILTFLKSNWGYSQNQRPYPLIDQTPGQLYHEIEKLNFLGSVLYVGAHPDDENNYLISYLANVMKARVGYLSLNRGDGGQNVLGPEMRELLGVIRTEELMDARFIEGTSQLFTRASDFGFSRNPDDALKHWDKENILSDVVWAFRTFKPDVIINRFDHRIFEGTHGQHTASAILSYEAFDLSGKADVYPDQLAYEAPWQAKRLFWNYSKNSFFEINEDVDQENSLYFKLNTYLGYIGRTNNELAGFSRSQHKSQAMGSAGKRPTKAVYLEPLKGDFENGIKNEDGIFAGINTTWSRLGQAGDEIGEILNRVQKNYDFKAPEKSIADLLKAYQLIEQLDNPHWKAIKSGEIKKIIAGILGLNFRVTTDQQWATLGAEIPLYMEVANHTAIPVVLKKIKLENASYDLNRQVSREDTVLIKKTLKIPEYLDYSTPYWLNTDYTRSWYPVEDQELIGLPESPAQLVADIELIIDDVPISFNKELSYRDFDQRRGEVNEPFAIVPEVSLKAKDHVLMFNDNKARDLQIEVEAFSDQVEGFLSLNLPEGWKAEPEGVKVELKNKSSSQSVHFKVTPPSTESEGNLTPVFKMTDGKEYRHNLHIIDYTHIPTQTVVLPEKVKVNNRQIQTIGKKIAYIKGAGDDVPGSLEKIGYEVKMISSKGLSLDELQKYDAVILGIRIYNLDRDLIANQDVLFDYVKEGGTLITQYSQSYGLLTEKIAPFTLKTAPLDRVTNENADVRFLAPDHNVLNRPNQITAKDFEGWVQERGLYFGHEWDAALTPILGMHDTGHPELRGSLLVGKYGKGYYVYTGLGFFRLTQSNWRHC